MNISLYFINFNDSFYLPFLKEHYGQFCNKIVMYDNYSSDNSENLARSLGFEVRKFGRHGQLNDQHYLHVKNQCWKEDRNKNVDYVIVCDADEFVTGPSKYIGPVPKVKGFNMISDDLPEKDIFEINTGYIDENYSKQAIFNPDFVEEINFAHGCHKNHIKTKGPHESGPLELYHFRQIGGVQRLIDRHLEYRKRLSEFNKMHRMGYHYMHSDDARRHEFEFLKQNAIELW